MKNILKSDFYKLQYNPARKLLPLAAIVITLVSVGFMLFVSGGATVDGESFTVTDVFGFEPAGSRGAQALAVLSTLYGFIGVIFAGLFISTEFSQGTIRNALCCGVSRTQGFLSKLVVGAVFLAVCMFLSCLTFVISFTAAYGFAGNADLLRGMALVFGMQFLYHFTFAAISCLIAFLIQNIVITVAAGMGIVFFSGIFVSVCESFDALKPIARFMPNYYITRLNDELYNTLFLVQGAAVCVAIIAAAAIIGCLLFKKQDIK